MSNSLKASFWMMFCNILQKGISFFTIPIFTRLLSTQEYGMYSLFLSWESIISIFATLNLSYQVFNNGMIKYENKKDEFTSSMIGLSFVSCLLSFLLLFLFYKPFSDFSGLNLVYLLFLFLDILFTAISSIWIVRRRFDFDYKKLTILTIIFSVMNPLLGIVLVLTMNDRLFARILSIVICSVLYGLICFFMISKESKKFFNKKIWKYSLKLDLPLIPHYISLVLLSCSDRIMIGMLVNKEATALYSISYNVSMIMNIVITAINSSLIPWIYHQMKDKKYNNLNQKLNFIIILVSIMSIVPMILGPEVVAVLGGKNYMDATTLIPIIASSIFMIYLYSIFIVIEMYYEKSMYITIGTVTAASINIILNYFCIKKFGYEAAAYTTLFSYAFLSFFHFIMMKKTLKENKVNHTIFNLKLLIVLSTFILTFSLLIKVLYNYLIIRYSLLIVIMILLIMQRKRIIQLIMKLKKE